MPVRYVGIDLETTGLDPARDYILEVGCVLADEDFSVLGQYEAVIGTWSHQLGRADDYVRDMHTANGLWTACSRSTTTLHEVEYALISMLDRIDKPILVGSAPHFDRGFLKHWMPTFEALLSHRHTDVRTARELLGREHEAEQPTEHRALPDILWAVDTLRRAKARCRA